MPELFDASALPASIPAAGPELLVALDIDGTLLQHDGSIREPVRQAVADLQSVGTRVVLSTGRSTFATLPVAHLLDLDDQWVVCSNGAMIGRLEPDSARPERDPYDVQPEEQVPGVATYGSLPIVSTVRLDDVGEGMVPPHVAPKRLSVTDRYTFDPEQPLRTLRGELPEAMYAVEALHGFKVNRPFPPGELAAQAELVPFEELWREPISRLTMREPSLDAHHFHTLMDRVGLHGVGYAVGWTAWLDIFPEGISKASALDVVRERSDIAPEATVAIGDGYNDVEMLRWAGLGAVMGQATNAVKAVADVVTAPVEEDGAARVLRALLDR